MSILKNLFLVFLSLSAMNTRSQTPMERDFFSWGQASPLPDADGLAGSYAGVSGGALLLAGGTNFPGNQRPWTGGTKTWYDKIYVLEQPGASWSVAGRLPRPLGYGISITGAGGLICLGGGDAQREYATAFILRYRSGRIETENLPFLPAPLTNAKKPGFNHCVKRSLYSQRCPTRGFVPPSSNSASTPSKMASATFKWEASAEPNEKDPEVFSTRFNSLRGKEPRDTWHKMTVNASLPPT